MIDGHMHLEYGPLTKEYVLEFVEAAKKMGLTKIQILDHTHRFKEFTPIYEGVKNAHVYQKEWLEKKKLDSIEEYHQLIEEIKNLDLDIEVTFGLEVCYVPEYEDFLKDILSKYPYDFLVGAVHSIDGILYDMNFSQEILWNVKDVNDIYIRYYELVLACVNSDLFTQLAHPDTIKLFNIYPTYDLTPTYHKIAEACLKHHVKAENNTGCYYRYGHKDMGLSDELLNIFKEHNVEMITASDAHYPGHVGTNIKDIYEKTMQ
ncbi:MAG: histidinol-phosphatase HisJ family protein [Coprobacillaceae bacterium]